jgi:hypothetical protein
VHFLRGAAGRPRTGEHGQVVVLLALLLPVFFVLGAVVLDVGNWYVHKRHLQTQVDAAALAGAHEFFGCNLIYEDPPVTANKSIRAHALEYAGDELRPPSSIDPLYTTDVRNRQVEEPGDVRVVLNSAAWWTQGEPTDGSPHDNTLDPDGDPITPGDPCTTKTLDVKATDDQVTNLWGLIPLHPSPKVKARVEIQQVIEQAGLLPFAVPEVDPARVAALFVNEDTGVKFDAQYLCSGGPNTTFSYWTTCADGADPLIPSGQANVDIPAENTSVIILVSKNDKYPNVSLPLPNVCTQSPGLIRCHAGSGPTGGASFIHGWSDTPGGYLTAGAPQIRDVSVTGCSDPSAPYFLGNADCSVGVIAKIDFGFPSNPVPNRTATPAGIGASATLHASANCGGSGDTLGYGGIFGTETTWSGGSKNIAAASGRNPLSIEVRWKPLPGPGFAKCFPLVAAPYAADDASGPLEYVDIENVDQAPYPVFVDGNSRNTGPGHLIRVVVGLNKPLQIQDPLDPPFLLRFASKSGSLNQALDCDAGVTFKDEIADGCQTRYRLNYYDWDSDPSTPYAWQDVICTAYPNPSDLPPPTFEPPAGTTAPNCVAAKTGDVVSMRQGLFARFQSNPDPAADNGCWPNNWPQIAANIPDWIQNHGPETDPRYVTLIITDFTAFTGSGAENVPVKYFAGFYATGWDVGPAGGGNQTGCPSENDPHPLGLSSTKDNGDVWGHFVNIVVPNPNGTASDQLCNFNELGTCIAVLVE